MPQSLGSIYVELQASTAGFVSALSKAAYEAQRTSKDISRSFGDLRGVAEQTFGAFGDFNPVISKLSFALQSAGSAASSAMKSLSGIGGVIGPIAALSAGAAVGFTALAAAAAGVAIETAKSIDEMGHLAESSGVSVETLSKLSFVAKQYDIDQESLAKGLQMMSVQMLKAATAGPGVVTAFDRLHLSVRNATGGLKDADTMFTEIIAKLDAMKDRTAAVGFAREIFGRQIGAAVLRIDPSGLQEWSDVANKAGIVITDQMFAAAHQFETTLNVIGAVVHGFAFKVEGEMLPALQAIASAMLEVANDGSSFGGGLLDTLGQMAKETLVAGGALVAAFEQAKLAVAAWITYTIAAYSALAGMGAAAAHLDWSGVKQAAKDGLATIRGDLELFITDSKKLWAGYGDFVHGIYGKATVAPYKKPDSDTGADIGKRGMLGIPPVDQIADLVSKLQQQAQAELALAAATAKSTAAQILQKAAGEADAKILEERNRLLDQQKTLEAELANAKKEQLPGDVTKYTQEIADVKKYLAALDAAVPEIRQRYAEIASGELAVKASKDLEDFIDKTDEEAAAARDMAAAYSQGGLAVQAAFDAAKLAPFENKLTDLGELISRMKAQGIPTTGPVGSTSLIGSLFGNLQQSYDQLDKGVEATPKQLSGVRDVELAKLNRQYQMTVQNEAAQDDLNAAYEHERERLEDVRSVLQGMGADTLLVDAKMHDAWVQAVTGWDQAANQIGSFSERFRAMVNEVELEGQTFGQKIFATFQKGIDGVSDSLAKFIVTGKSDFRSLMSSIAEELLKAQIQKTFANIFGGLFGPKTGAGAAGGVGPGGTAGTFKGSLGIGGALAGAFGVHPGGKAPAGTAADPLWVKMASAVSGIPGVPGSSSPTAGGGKSGVSDPFSELTSKLEGMFSKLLGGLSSIFSQLGGALSGAVGGIAHGIGAIFGLAGGGDVQAGRPYIVGEQQAEVFVPHESGRIIKSVPDFFRTLAHRDNGGDVTTGMPYLVGENRPEVYMPEAAERSGAYQGTGTYGRGGGGSTTVNFHVNGVPDIDSFNRSKAQLYSEQLHQQAVAHQRNRG